VLFQSSPLTPHLSFLLPEYPRTPSSLDEQQCTPNSPLTPLFLFNQGKEGAVIVKTKLALLITHYPETVQPGQAATTVEKLGDYLINTGY
jgi:Profilin